MQKNYGENSSFHLEKRAKSTLNILSKLEDILGRRLHEPLIFQAMPFAVPPVEQGIDSHWVYTPLVCVLLG